MIPGHNKELGGMYLLAARINVALANHDFAYKYSQKAVELRPSHDAHYVFSISAYNLKKYDASLLHITNAIELKPPDSGPNLSEYQKFKDAVLKKLPHADKL